VDDTAAVEPAGAVAEPTAGGLPQVGYQYGVTRYADLILKEAFPAQFEAIAEALDTFRATLGELQAGGGNETPFVTRFDRSLSDRGWGRRTITVAKTIDERPISRARGHAIDMFAGGPGPNGYPGVAVEMEWNNKDPFFDRDLLNFQALHREGVLAVGVIVTRGPELQRMIKSIIGEGKYGESTTHWSKLVSRVNLGGGGECPLLLVGIELERIDGGEIIKEIAGELDAAEADLRAWKGRWPTYKEAQQARKERRAAALGRLPPLQD
jgi:hypothetical protein